MTSRTTSVPHRAAIHALALFATSLALHAAPAPAQGYPGKPLRIVVPFPPGGPADMLGRVIGEKLQRSLGQPVVVFNKDGAGSILGVDIAAKSNPDGHTLLLGNLSLIINASTGRKLPYDTFKDLVPVSLVFAQPLVLAIHPSLPATSTKALVEYAKSNPGKLRYGSSGVGASIHLTTELFRTAFGIELTHVPYKGVTPALTDLLGGRIELLFPGIAPALPLINSGKIRALGLTSKQRSAVLPDLPTLAESGAPDFEAIGWYGILVPTGTPRSIVTRLNQELRSAMAMQDLRERLATQGGDAMSSTQEQFGAYMQAEVKKWGDLIKSRNIQLE